MRSNLSIFLFLNFVFNVQELVAGPEDFLHCFFCVILLYFIFKSMIHFELLFIKCEVWVEEYFYFVCF